MDTRTQTPITSLSIIKVLAIIAVGCAVLLTAGLPGQLLSVSQTGTDKAANPIVPSP